jgi:hypothetical protein
LEYYLNDDVLTDYLTYNDVKLWKQKSKEAPYYY